MSAKVEAVRLHPAVERLVSERGWQGLTKVQLEAARAILEGKNVLITAPTGEGKTEAALLPLLSILLNSSDVKPVAILYVTPMRALINDLYRRITFWSRPLGFTVAKKHGDVPSRERAARLRNPPHILLITPESLEIDLDWAPRFRDYYRNVRAVIVDELHELLTSKRGVQLLFLLERLKELAGDFQRIGLSATLGNPQRALELLSGSSQRPRTIVSGQANRRFEFEVRFVREDEDPWKGVADELKGAGGPTLVFTNSRYVAEKVGHELERAGVSEVFVHHSSVSADVRESIEQRLREGLKIIVVCTKTLELGIDIGAISEVVQIRAPGSASALIQRAGRSGHVLGGTSRGLIIAMGPVDFAEAIAESNMAKEGIVEGDLITTAPIDVVAKEVIGYLLAKGNATPAEIYRVFKGVKVFRSSFEEFLSLLDYMSRNGVIERLDGSLKVGRAFYRIWRLREDGERTWQARSFADFFSTIPKRDFFTVRSGDMSVGYIDSYFVYRNLRPGDVIRLAGKAWRITRIDDLNEVIEVVPSEGAAEIPLWRGEVVNRSKEVAAEFYKVLFGLEPCKATCDPRGLSELSRIRSWYVNRFLRVDSKNVVVESVGDEQILLAPLGSRVSETLGLLLSYLVMRERGLDVRYRSTFYGLSISTGKADIIELLKSIDPAQVPKLIYEALEFSPMFYEEASQARYDLGKLGDIDKEYDEPFIRGVKDYIMRTKLDVEGAVQFLKALRDGSISVQRVEGPPSPLAEELLSVPSVRPWVQDLSKSIAKVLEGWAFTDIEVSDELGLPLKTVVSKLKDMRRPDYGSRRVVAFLDVESKEWRWTLLTSLKDVEAMEEFRDSFAPLRLDGEFKVSVRRSYDSESRERLVRPKDIVDNREDLVHLMGGDEVYELRVSSALGEGPTVIYHYVNSSVARELILNAIAFIQRNPRLEGRVSA
ncbi:MAG: DEAD/DEAH box helicase [Acidilobus sp.]